MELFAHQHFVKDPDNMVFVPLLGLGCVDLVVLNKKTCEIRLYDIKFASKRMSNYKYEKENRITTKIGDLIGRKLKPLQKKIGVELLYFDEQGKIYEKKKPKAYKKD